MFSLLQTACWHNNYEMILLLLNHDIHDEAEFCIDFDHHLQWLKDTNHKDTYLFIQIKENNLQKLLESEYTYSKYFKPVREYIMTVLKRDKPISYKHQRKLLGKLVKEAQNEITKEMWRPRRSGLGLYNSFLYR